MFDSLTKNIIKLQLVRKQRLKIQTCYPLTLNDVIKAHERIKDYVHKTPVLTSSTFDSIYGRKFYFKAENFQKTGSFKIRGALNAVSIIRNNKEIKGVTTHSSGNHGQALAWAAREAGLACEIVTPNNTSMVKRDAIKGYGAEVTLCEPNPASRTEICERISTEKGYVYVTTADHYDVIAGQGTIAIELMEQVPELDAILVAASGGGMSAGICMAAKSIKPGIKVFIVEPFGKELEPCLKTGERLWPNPPQFVDTIAEGIRTQQLGHLTFPIILDLAEKQVFTVTNTDIEEAMKFAFQRMEIVIEGAAGAAMAAAMSDQIRSLPPDIRHVGVVLCGGNVDLCHFPFK